MKGYCNDKLSQPLFQISFLQIEDILVLLKPLIRGCSEMTLSPQGEGLKPLGAD